MEQREKERTAELPRMNGLLQAEINKRRQAERALKGNEERSCIVGLPLPLNLYKPAKTQRQVFLLSRALFFVRSDVQQFNGSQLQVLQTPGSRYAPQPGRYPAQRLHGNCPLETRTADTDDRPIHTAPVLPG